MKKIVKRISTMLIAGLVVTIAAYPMLHELEHSVVAIFVLKCWCLIFPLSKRIM